MEKKKSPVGLIILIIILMCGCLVGGYYINESGVLNNISANNSKESKNKNKDTDKEGKEQTETIYETVDSKISGLIQKVIGGHSCAELEKFANDKKITVNDISNLDAVLFVSFDFAKDNKTEVSLEDFTNQVQKYLGKDYKFDPTKIDFNSISCIMYKYDATNKKFLKQETACGWTCGPRTNYKITKAVDTNGVLELTTRVIYASHDQGKDGYYSDYQKTNKIGDFENYFDDSLFDKGSVYKFTFKDEDGNYVFVSSEPVNE